MYNIYADYPNIRFCQLVANVLNVVRLAFQRFKPGSRGFGNLLARMTSFRRARPAEAVRTGPPKKDPRYRGWAKENIKKGRLIKAIHNQYFF
jgi:hypothetical protein